MGKGEISWSRETELGWREFYAKHVGHEWRFFWRERRYQPWQPLPHPPLEDWLALLDGVRRRIPRRLVRPEEEARIRQRIRELFPEAHP